VRRSRTAAAACIAVLAAVATGCGRDRIEPPDTSRPATPQGEALSAFPAAGIYFARPSNWPFQEGRAPLVASTSSGTATIAVWRYPRSEPLPRTKAELNTAQESLEAAVKTRDPTFELERKRHVELDGEKGIEVLGTETVAGQKRRVRSTHLFAHKAEIVLDAYAPVEEFNRLDSEVFGPIRETLRIERPRG
jgi:hypothetical protein